MFIELENYGTFCADMELKVDSGVQLRMAYYRRNACMRINGKLSERFNFEQE